MFDTLPGAARSIALVAEGIVFGACLFPLYAPTGRFLDRPLRRIVVAAAAVGLAGAVLGALGSGSASAAVQNLLALGQDKGGLAHLALSALALAIAVTLRRNSWTARPQGAILALVAAGVLVSGSPPSAAGDASGLDLTLQMLRLMATAAIIGGIVPLALMFASLCRYRDSHTRVKTLVAAQRSSLVAAAACGIILAARALSP